MSVQDIVGKDGALKRGSRRLSVLAFIAVLGLALAAPSYAQSPRADGDAPEGILYSWLLLLLCVSLTTKTPGDLWRRGILLYAAFASTAGAAGAPKGESLENVPLWGLVAVAAGFRPVIEMFIRGLRRPRLDAVDMLCATGGAWLAVAGLVSTMVSQNRVGSWVGQGTATVGVALVTFGLVREVLRLRWLRGVAAGSDDRWTLEAGPSIPELPRLLDLEDDDQVACPYHLIYWPEGRVGPPGGYRDERAKGRSMTIGTLPWVPDCRPRGVKFVGVTLVIMASAPVVLIPVVGLYSASGYFGLILGPLIMIVAIGGLVVSRVSEVLQRRAW